MTFVVDELPADVDAAIAVEPEEFASGPPAPMYVAYSTSGVPVPPSGTTASAALPMRSGVGWNASGVVVKGGPAIAHEERTVLRIHSDGPAAHALDDRRPADRVPVGGDLRDERLRCSPRRAVPPSAGLTNR